MRSNLDLYIANPKKTHRTFQYRMGVINQVFMLPIFPQQQAVIRRKDMDEETLNGIIHAAEVYGAVCADDVRGHDKDKRISYLYRVGAPVTDTEIRHAMAHNDKVLIDESNERMDFAAIAISQGLTELTNGRLEALEIKVSEVPHPKAKPTMGQQQRTVRNPSEPSMRPRTKTAKKRA